MDDDFSWRTPNSVYAWSQDYAAVLDAMAGGAVMATCLYDSLRNGIKIFDACFMMRRPVSYKHVEFVASARGIEYFSARNADEFIALCEKYEVKFLDPRADNAVLARLRSSLAASQLEAGTQIWRLTLPFRRHAAGPDSAPPLRFSVEDSRRIAGEVEHV